jgi:hypothetical protein
MSRVKLIAVILALVLGVLLIEIFLQNLLGS